MPDWVAGISIGNAADDRLHSSGKPEHVISSIGNLMTIVEQELPIKICGV
jgi:hypothetical protein